MIPNGDVPQTLERALDALATGDAEARRQTVRALFHVPTRIALSALPTAMNDEDWRVRKQSIELAISLEKEAIPMLIGALAGPAEAIAFRNAAVEALIALSRIALPDLIAALPSMDSDGLRLALDVLGRSKRPEAIGPLIDYLRTEDLSTRLAACEALGMIGGSEAIEVLQTLLVDTDRLLSLCALEGINRLQADAPVHLVIGLARDPILLESSLTALGRTSSIDAADFLLEALTNRSRRIVETAFRALFCWLERNSSQRADLAARLNSQANKLQNVAIEFAQLEDSGLRKPAMSLCVLLASAGDQRCFDFIVQAIRVPTALEDTESMLDFLGPVTIPVVERMLESADKRSRVLGLVLLSRLAPENPGLLRAIHAGLLSEDLDLRCAAASAVSQLIGSANLLPDNAIVSALFSAAAETSSRGILEVLATRALQAIARSSPQQIREQLAPIDVHSEGATAMAAILSVIGAESDVVWLVAAAASGSVRTRLLAIEALGHVGGHAALDAIRFATTDEVISIALAAIRAFGRMKDTKSASHTLLQIAVSEGDTTVRCAALAALGPIGDASIAAEIEPLAASSIPEISVSAMLCLSELSAPNLDVIALSALDHQSLSVARTAIALLEKCVETSPFLADNLVSNLSHWSAEIRLRLIDLFIRLGQARVIPALRSRLAEENDSSVRSAIEHAINSLSIEGAR